ncbi:MAG: shikimate dehydrogenase [Desulfosporosinus sp.]|nr:shikimate dehydrogenase [Desulfosporosinus sp.]
MEKHYAVIGHPIEHSLSPEMHKAGYVALGLDAEYQRFDVEPSHLAEAVEGLCALGFSGWNVTLPHKENIISLLDTLTPQAKRAGAVNTVKIQAGQRIGHNTDGDGFVCAVEGELKGFKGKKAVLLGAGGAAKGIALALAEQGMQLHILNRTPEKAERLVQAIQREGGTATAGVFAPGVWLGDVDLLVQTTSVGLHGERFPFSVQGISEQALVVDIIFNPRETAFLQDAKQQGCRTLNGLGMLLHQGALAWEFWLGGQAPVEEMRQALQKQLSQRLSTDGKKEARNGRSKG